MAAVSIFASGSEVSIAVAAQKLLAEKKVAARVVSIPCMDLFFEQPEAYRREVIGSAKVRVGVEAAVVETAVVETAVVGTAAIATAVVGTMGVDSDANGAVRSNGGAAVVAVAETVMSTTPAATPLTESRVTSDS